MGSTSLRRTLAGVALSLVGTGVANAALYLAPNGQAVYDSTQNITWVADANLAASSPFGLPTCVGSPPCPDGIGTAGPGTMNWTTAEAWITAMNAANYLGVNNWRLPTTVQPDPTCSEQLPNSINETDSRGFGCTGSEMGHLYYVDGVTTYTPGLFSNVQGASYWSATQYAPDPSNAWFFHFGGGFEGAYPEFGLGNGFVYAWAVAPGDISQVPIPSAVWLFHSALAALGWVRRPRRRSLSIKTD